MTTYRVHFATGASTYVTVEADTPDEARLIADETFSPPHICAQCSGWGQTEGIEIGDDWEQDESEHGVWEA